MLKTVLFQTIQFNISVLCKCKFTVELSKTFLFQAIQFSQTVLIQTIHFSVSTQFKYQNNSLSSNLVSHISSIWPIDRTLLGTTTPGHSWPGSDGNDGGIHIPQSSSITGTLPSDCLVSYPGHS